jgi:uncharacterized protein (DUF849 family)
MEKLIISAAITGAAVMPMQSPYIPVTPKQIADDAVRAAEAGAACVHIHARDPKDGRPTSDIEIFREIVGSIKQRSDVVICMSTTGAAGVTPAGKIKPVLELKPELASYDVGSVSLSGERLLKHYKESDYKYAWEKEILERRSKVAWVNTFDDLHLYGSSMQEVGTKPEYEIFEIGWLYNTKYLLKTRQGYMKPPLWLQFAVGGFGTIGGTPEHLLHLKQTADTLFGRDTYKWSVIGVGYPTQFYMASLAMIMGGNIRVGIEDNLNIAPGELAKSNGELVDKAVRMARELDREIATPDEARAMLCLKGKDNVNF